MKTITIEIDETAIARFDKTSTSWTAQEFEEYNWLFLRNQQTWANDMLRVRGHLFVNDVLSMLGLPRTKSGQILGWTYWSQVPYAPNKVPFVDFGCWDAMANGEDVGEGIDLRFNVDGPIIESLA